MANYQAEKKPTNLYVHLDKNKYLTNESIWFKAYILNGPDIENKVLFVRLTDLSRNVVLKYQCPIYDIRANGDLLLPDTLREGEYYFYAYTSSMVNFSPRQIFTQKIKIYKNTAETMQAEAGVVDTTQLFRGGSVNILLKVKKGQSYVSDAKCNFRLMVDNIPIKTGKMTTNFLGEATIPFTYPHLSNDQTVQVDINIEKERDRGHLVLNLRHEASPVIVDAYAEGGHLITGISNNLIIITKDKGGEPLSTPIQFEKDGKVIANVSTNQYGIARLPFIPSAGADYGITIPGGPIPQKTKLGNEIELTGFGLRLSRSGDNFYALVTNKTKSDSAIIVLRDHDKILWDQAIPIRQNDSVRVVLPVNNIPKQILSLAVFGNSGKCYVERLFMNKQAENYKISVQTDKTEYATRRKVRVTIDSKDLDGDPILANLSVAVAERSRIDLNSYATILDSYYFKELDSDHADPIFHGIDGDDIDLLLATKRWWSGDWLDILNYKPRGHLRILKNMGGISGQITRTNNKPASDIKQLSVYSKNSIVVVDVDKDGQFDIAPEYLTVDPSERKYLLLGTDFYDDHLIHFQNYEDMFDESVKISNSLSFLDRYSTFVKLNDRSGMNLDGSIQLKEVTIKERIRLSTDQEGVFPVFRSETCNDYVCIYNLLNCPWHETGTKPVEGGIYSYKGHNVVYHGCDTKVANSNNLLLKTTSVPHPFILPNYEKDPPGVPEMRSTIYWNPNLNTDKSGKVSFEFYTSDITGDFMIMVQGIDGKTFRPLYITSPFKVK